MNSSSIRRSLLLPAFLLAASLLSPGHCMAWSLGAQPVEGILVLQNGNILRGKLQKQGDHYYVTLPKGQLQVRESQVDMVCENLEEAYLRRRETRVGSSADSHLQLASWCLRHGLFTRSAAELKAAEVIDSEHPRLALQQRQLEHALKNQQRKLERQQATAIAEAVVPFKPAPLDPATLEKAPPWARILFVRQIQPLVINSCATSGCHQSDSESSFQMNRLAIEGAGHPGTSMRNLAALLQQIDWDQAEQSNLLSRAKAAHGPLATSTPLPEHKLRVLESWVKQLAQANVKEADLTRLALLAKRPARISPKSTLVKPVARRAGQIQQASYESVNSADPFDPAAFNRRHATEQRAAVQQAAVSEESPAVDTEEVPQATSGN